MTTRQDDIRTLQFVFDAMIYAVVVTGTDGRIRLINSSAESLFGYSAEEMLGSELATLLSSAAAGGTDSAFSRIIDGATSEDGITLVGRHKHGGTFPIHLCASRLDYGEKAFHVCQIRDITAKERAEKLHRQRERSFRQLVDSVTDYAICMIDADGRVTSWNSGAERLKQYSAEEIIGRHFGAFYEPAERAGAVPEANLRTALSAGKYVGEGWRVRKDGSRFWASVVIEAIVDGDGQLVGFAKVTRDATERRNAEIELRENAAQAARERESQVKTVVDTAVDGVILIDVRGTVKMFNPACERLFGFNAAEVIGQNVKMLMPTPYRDEHDRYLDNYLTTGDRKIIGIGREVTGQRKDGSTFPMELSVGESSEGGETVFVGIIRDLTERKAAEQKVRESAARVEAVVNTAVDGVILIDSRARILMFNPACERLFGYSSDEVLWQNVKMLMPAPYREQHDGYLNNYQTTGEKKVIGIGREVTGQRKNGSVFPMELSVGEAEQDGESIFVGIIHDLTERKRGEEQLVRAQKMETVGQLSAGIAHDFNNLLTVIIGNAEFLTEQLAARPDLQTFARMIGQAGGRGAELTQRLLAFGRRQRLQPRPVDCNQLLSSIEELLRRTLREDIEIRTMLDEAVQPGLVDFAQIESSILNLALNAQDAMPQGGCLTLSTSNVVLDDDYRDHHPEVPPGHYVLISVTDDGQGMPPDVQKRVFEPFFTTKEVGKGTGLGLSMVYGFIKQSNGHIAIYSEPGLGTTVRLYLPTAGDAPSLVPADPQPLTTRKNSLQTVLVTEDDPFVRTYAVKCLESLGYRVLTAVDGNEALQKLKSPVEIDLLFSDVVMPGGINGSELAERARELRPTLRVLLTSGYALETLAARGRLPAGVEVLNKPYRRADLGRLLQEILAAPQ